MIPAKEALKKLQDGNQRFVDGLQNSKDRTCQLRRTELAEGQEPFAIVLGCSDSRVPAELVFDQGLGDLFVIRVAGNIVAPSQIGSVEFAADAFGCKLVVVMGHSMCGAVIAAIDEVRTAAENRSPNLRAIVDRIRPAVEELASTESEDELEQVIAKAVRANIRAAANHLRHGSRILEELIQKNQLLVVGAEYSLETGRVEFIDGLN